MDASLFLSYPCKWRKYHVSQKCKLVISNRLCSLVCCWFDPSTPDSLEAPAASLCGTLNSSGWPCPSIILMWILRMTFIVLNGERRLSGVQRNRPDCCMYTTIKSFALGKESVELYLILQPHFFLISPCLLSLDHPPVCVLSVHRSVNQLSCIICKPMWQNEWRPHIHEPVRRPSIKRHGRREWCVDGLSSRKLCLASLLLSRSQIFFRYYSSL